MHERMLPGKVESVDSDTTLLEYRMEFVKSDKGIPKCGRALSVLHITPGYIAKVQKSSQCTHHRRRNMALNRGQIDLHVVCSTLYI